ncbi:MAG: penicillin-binding protein 2, partial [Alphaproteobacteria bacterium]|nr:penicillin-binding protein 2 [Alphaproteobacteria bacterium]
MARPQARRPPPDRDHRRRSRSPRKRSRALEIGAGPPAEASALLVPTRRLRREERMTKTEETPAVKPSQRWTQRIRREDAKRQAARDAVDVGRVRLVVTGAVFALAFIALAVRTVEISLFPIEVERKDTRIAIKSGEGGERGRIADRNGLLLATNLATASLYARPRQLIDTERAIAGLAAAMPDLDPDYLRERLSGDRPFVWIKRHITPRQQRAVHELGLPGVGFMPDKTRVYPQGALAAHVVGFTDIDNKGISGVEKFFDRGLAGDESAAPRSVALSLDLRVQHALREELTAAVDSFDAVGGAGIVLDIATGEVLAMVSLPDFDPMRGARIESDAFFNRVTLGVYEMGSTFKTFTTAMALQNGKVGLDGGYDASQPLKYASYTIKDDHAKNRWLSVPEIFIHSSNIGSARMAMDVGVRRHQEFLRSLGLLEAPKIELPEVGQPLVPKPWREINTVTVAFGHGVAVSPLQLAAGVAAVAGGGEYVSPTLIKREDGQPIPRRRAVSPEVSSEMRYLLRLVVEQGTGKKAEVDGYAVGGKTGTAEKVGKGGYQRKSLLSSFVGVFPMESPRYVVLAMIDEPKGQSWTYGFASGGWTAAPAVGRVVTRIAP